MQAVLVKNANRMMTVAGLLEDGIELSFADGYKGVIPYTEVPEIRACARVSSLELPSPYEIVLEVDRGERVEIPWDFARHLCDFSLNPSRGTHYGEVQKHSRPSESLGDTDGWSQRAASLSADDRTSQANSLRLCRWSTTLSAPETDEDR